jgi:hypothetical protein
MWPKWNNGMLDYWNIDKIIYNGSPILCEDIFHLYANIAFQQRPIFHHPNIPNANSNFI